MARTSAIVRFLQAFAVLLCLVFVLRRSLGENSSSSDWHVSSWLAPNPSNRFKLPPDCDPYAELGHLYTADDLHDSRYIIYNDHKQPELDAPDQDWVVPSLTSTIHEHKFVELDFLRNRSVLMIGDSIDRNLVTHFGRRGLAGTKGLHKFFEIPDHAHIATSKFESHKIGMAYLPEVNFTVYNWFLMGLGVKQEVPFFHAREDLPQEFGGRLETFYLPLLRANLIAKPDLIIFNTGFWDLEYLARSRTARFNLPDIHPRTNEGPTGLKIINLGDGNPLSLTELAYHRLRLRGFLKMLIDSLKAIYGPNQNSNYLDRPIELMYRSMQLGNASLNNAFAAERIHQLEESNRLVLKEFGIKVIEWGKMTIGLDSQLDDPSIVCFILLAPNPQITSVLTYARACLSFDNTRHAALWNWISPIQLRVPPCGASPQPVSLECCAYSEMLCFQQPVFPGLASTPPIVFGDMMLFYLYVLVNRHDGVEICRPDALPPPVVHSPRKRLLSGSKDEWVGCDWIRNRNLHYRT